MAARRFGIGSLLLLVSAAGCAAQDPVPEAVSFLGEPLFAPALAPARRAVLEAELAAARALHEREPESEEAAVWLGRRLAYLGRYRAAIEVYTRALERHPASLVLLRHRGHRWITVRELGRALLDLELAAELTATVPDTVEPDGQPNALGLPRSTSHTNIFYHLGLARFLQADFEGALAAYRACLAYSTNDDMDCATRYWLALTLWRLGRPEEARAVLAPVRDEMDVVENFTYHRLLLAFRGERAATEALQTAELASLDAATAGFGLGQWCLAAGEPEAARAHFEHVVAAGPWAAFGTIAAEAELARWENLEHDEHTANAAPGY